MQQLVKNQIKLLTVFPITIEIITQISTEGVHSVSQEATDAYENARKKIQKHFNARYSEEIILTSGTTHSINLVASGFTNILSKNDEILISELEHHSNIVPWQMMCKKNGAKT